MRSQCSRVTLGVWGLRVCSLDVVQPFATVRNCCNRSREGRMAVSSAHGVTFGGFKRRVASFRMAGVAFGDSQTCFLPCRKSFCMAGSIFAFSMLSGDELQFSLQVQHFKRLVLRVFCEWQCQGYVTW